MTKPNGTIIYDGPSMLDGQPIVVVAVGLAKASTNSKTGGMIQTHILRSDMKPTEAIFSGQDSTICGDCIHRGDRENGKGRTCYVNVGQGPGSVYRTYVRGGYPVCDDFSIFDGLKIRLGSYGDPAAVPLDTWRKVTAGASGWTGYTHQWRDCPSDFSLFCMASADSEQDARKAWAMGYRTFRVSMPGDIIQIESEAICPAAAESGAKIQCSQCMACGGGNRRGSITIAAHGGSAVMANVKRRAA